MIAVKMLQSPAAPELERGFAQNDASIESDKALRDLVKGLHVAAKRPKYGPIVGVVFPEMRARDESLSAVGYYPDLVSRSAHSGLLARWLITKALSTAEFGRQLLDRLHEAPPEIVPLCQIEGTTKAIGRRVSASHPHTLSGRG
jgi:hypothetical protein